MFDVFAGVLLSATLRSHNAVLAAHVHHCVSHHGPAQAATSGEAETASLQADDAGDDYDGSYRTIRKLEFSGCNVLHAQA
jgi:hypothetical protein